MAHINSTIQHLTEYEKSYPKKDEAAKSEFHRNCINLGQGNIFSLHEVLLLHWKLCHFFHWECKQKTQIGPSFFVSDKWMFCRGYKYFRQTNLIL